MISNKFEFFDDKIKNKAIAFLDFFMNARLYQTQDKTNPLDSEINKFLELLHEDEITASFRFERIFQKLISQDEIKASVTFCRFVGTLAAILYSKYEENDADRIYEVYQSNNHYYRPNDFRYFIDLFLINRKTPALIDSLKQSFSRKAFIILKDSDPYIECIEYTCGYYIDFNQNDYRKCETFFLNLLDESVFKEYRTVIYDYLAHIYFLQSRLEKALDVLKNMHQDTATYHLNVATSHTLIAKKKDLNTTEWRSNLRTALKSIDKGIKICEEKICEEKTCEEKGLPEYSISKMKLLLQKAFIHGELKEIDKAYTSLKEGYSIYKENAQNDIAQKAWANFKVSGHLWIVLEYMHEHSHDTDTISDNISFERIVENMCNSEDFHRFPSIYQSVLAFRKSRILPFDIPNKREIEEHLLQLLRIVLQIKYYSKIREPSKHNILYYTSLKNVKLLLADEREDVQHRLPLFHAYHMNDPQEGTLLYTLLGESGKSPSSTKRFQYNPNYVFLKSFFSYSKEQDDGISEFLPMWVQYGDDAKGCCVVLNPQTFNNCDLRRITYIDKDGHCKNAQINACLEELTGCYGSLKNICDSISVNETRRDFEELVSSIIFQIAYLFKDKSYEHEQEVRILKTLSPADEDQFREIPGDIPKVYVYNDVPTYIDEIILGAKVPNPDDYVPYFTIHGKKMWKDYPDKQLKITHSSLQYR